MTERDNTIIVIGAGVAGLAAARDLARAGLHVILIEARDRIGGRVYTKIDQSSPVPIELGAEFIHGKSREIFEVIDAARLLVCDATERHWFFEDGKLSKSADFWHSVHALMDQMKSTQPDQSFADFLQSLPDNDETRRAKAIAARFVQGFHAADVHRAGVHGLIKANQAEEEVGDKSFRLINGYAEVVQTLADDCKKHHVEIQLETTATQISWSRRNVEVVCSNQDGAHNFKGKGVVITLPLGVLQAAPNHVGAVRFAPELPSGKLNAIQHVLMGNVVKLNLQFRTRFWEDLKLPDVHEDLADLGFVHYPEAPLPTWWTLLPVRAPILVGWVGGPDARAELEKGETVIIDQGVASLSQLLKISTNRLESLLESAHYHDWFADPYARGAYAYLPVNGVPAQQALAEPIDGTLFFAGEATSVGHIGTVHGALMTGERAAREVLEGK